jgi:isoleucyl-tRNA synthetase
VHVPGSHDRLAPLLDVIAEELNVRVIRFAESEGAFGRWRAKPNYRALGPRLGPGVRAVAQTLAEDDGSIAAALARGEPATVAGVDLGPDDVDLVHEVQAGWGVASEGGVTVALDLELDDDLRIEGVARDLIRAIQDLRKAAGLAVTDRIELGIVATPRVEAALATHRDIVLGETLAVRLETRELEGAREEVEIGEERATISLRRAEVERA